MKNLLKFFAFVALLSLAISALYDYRLKHGSLSTLQRTTPEKYTLASSPHVDPFGFFFRRPRGVQNPNDEALVQNSLGSGVIVSNEGHIITNNHVVDQVDEIEVQLSDGRTKKARLVGADSEVDLAVLKVDDPGVKPLKLAD